MKQNWKQKTAFTLHNQQNKICDKSSNKRFKKCDLLSIALTWLFHREFPPHMLEKEWNKKIEMWHSHNFHTSVDY